MTGLPFALPADFHDMIAVRPAFAAIGPAMEALVARLGGAAAGEDLTADLRLAVTEVLNNVVEHSGHPAEEPVLLHFGRDRSTWWVCVEDRGVPLPTGLLDPAPEPAEPSWSRPVDELPEGGWGWLLIRGSVDALRHVREDGRNYLLLEKRAMASAA